MSSNAGTKVTSDPEGLRNPKNENPGVVTSDSLAAESIREGGSFAANSDARGPMDQPSYSTTANNTDTSNARVLDAAPDAEARQASEEWNESSQLNAGRSLGKAGGRGPTYNVAAAAAADGGLDDGSENVQQPKGKNLREGGFDSDAPNASFNNDVGGRKDPGRAALETFETENVPVAGGAGPRQTEVTNDGQYDVLDETSA